MRKSGFFIINSSPENWPACKENYIFGIKEGGRDEKLAPGDILIVRVTRGQGTREHGAREIWKFLYDEIPNKVPWTDARYKKVLHCEPLLVFNKVFMETFDERRYSLQIKMHSMQLSNSIIGLSEEQAKNYVLALIEDKERNEPSMVSHVKEVFAQVLPA